MHGAIEDNVPVPPLIGHAAAAAAWCQEDGVPVRPLTHHAAAAALVAAAAGVRCMEPVRMMCLCRH